MTGCAFGIHKALGSGFLEKVYENAMMLELSSKGLRVRQQVPLPVQYRGEVIGDFYADLLVEERLICELKAVDKLAQRHELQLVNYLTAAELENGLLLNFGRSVTVRRKFGACRNKSRPS